MVAGWGNSSNNNSKGDDGGNGSSSHSDSAAALAKEEGEKSILLMDANRDNASVLETMLVRAGFLVTAYTNPVLAATHFSTNPSYDLVLWNMCGAPNRAK